MPLLEPRHGELHTKTLVRIADSTPLNLFMIKDPKDLPKTINIQKLTQFLEVEEGVIEIATEEFLKTYLPGDENEFYKISDTVYVESGDTSMIHYKRINEKGQPTGDPRGMKRSYFLEDYPIYVAIPTKNHIEAK